VLASQPDAIVMMFGANDCYTQSWQGPEHFVEGYESFAKEMISLVGNKDMFYALHPPPMYPAIPRGGLDYKRGDNACDEHKRNEVYPGLFQQIKKDLELSDKNFVNTFTMLGGEKFDQLNLFCIEWEDRDNPGIPNEKCDRSHPNPIGHWLIAKDIAEKMTPDLEKFKGAHQLAATTEQSKPALAKNKGT
jgi:lysophospholipase L1-like esterase